MRELLIGVYKNSIGQVIIKRKIPSLRLVKFTQFQAGYGCRQRRFSYSDINYSACSKLAREKNLTRELLDRCGLPIAKGEELESLSDLERAYENFKKPVVIKPIDQMWGRGVSVNVDNFEEAKKAFSIAQKLSDKVLIEEQIKGEDHRLLIINNKFAAGLKRMRPYIIGDGESTIKQLIEKENLERKKSGKWIKEILIEETVFMALEEQGYNLDSVLEKGKKIFVRMTGNISSGGISEDITDKVCKENIELAKKAVNYLGLEIAGVDFLTTDITKPIQETGGVISEVNHDPDVMMHQNPYIGKPRMTAQMLVDYVFPDPKKAWILIWLEGKLVKDEKIVDENLNEKPKLVKCFKDRLNKEIVEIKEPGEKLYNYLINPLVCEIVIR